LILALVLAARPAVEMGPLGGGGSLDEVLGGRDCCWQAGWRPAVVV